MTWHLGRLCAFDLESTAPDPTEARIVTACVAYVDGTGASDPVVHSWLIDPGVEIPDEAAAIHGVSTEQARADGVQPATALPEIVGALSLAWGLGMPVVGHNVGGYDLTLLACDLQRHGLPPLEVAGPVVDTLCLDKAVDKYRKGKRTLTATAEHYQVALDGAHDAMYDALASARIAWRIAQRFPNIAAMSLDELHHAQVGWHAEQAASLQAYFRRSDPNAVVDGQWPVRGLPAAVSS